MKKLTLRAVAITAMLTLLLAGIAYAAVQLGQEWYYDTRFTAYKEHQPEKHQAIMDSLQKDIQQHISGPAADLVQVTIQDVAWADEKEVMTVSVLATPKDGDTYELHSAWSMDVDGASVGAIDPNDEESRLHHWLWTEKGFGLPQDVMFDPAKQLLLVTVNGRLLIGDTEQQLPGSSEDAFTTEEGPVMVVNEYDLSRLLPETFDAMYDNVKVPEGEDEAEYLARIEQMKRNLQEEAKAVSQAMKASTDAEGYLTLRCAFTVQTFHDDTYGEPVSGEVSFRVKVKEK